MKNHNNLEVSFTDRAKDIKAYIIKQNIGNPNLIRGCSKSEIIKLEQEYQIFLPESYRVFLENFGYGLGGKVMNDCDLLYNDLFHLTHIIRNEILVDDGDSVLPEKAFVFAKRYFEQFWFFDASGTTKEPPIYYFHIDKAKFEKIAYSIFDIIEIEAQHSLKIQQYREKINNRSQFT